MKIKLTGNKILAIREPRKEFTDGGIYIPDLHRQAELLPEQAMERAKVVAAGEGLRNKKNNKLKPVQVKKGDVILFNGSKCLDVELDGKKYIMVRESEIFGVIE